ncbi:uncharacterized protein LOC105693460 [Athalia rosae]|uniref:uncharacterized protein LOC105693460 n=1 Tax=Athalia rosae TaxID=37344 RepID=UPI00203499AF|nr:uncharacterized protein LOC105693460 [Athalia rosae]
MATDIEDWLNAPYLQKLLRDVEKDETVEVSEIVIKGATAKGDNYASDMFRVTVDISRIRNGAKINEKESFMVKVAPVDQRAAVISAVGIFVTELSLIQTLLPKMNKIIGNVCPGRRLSARCLRVQFESPTHAIMEDLSTIGFRMADRHSGLDLEHCLVAIRNLGRFHATSVALVEEEPDILANYTKGMYHKDQHPMMTEFFATSLKGFAKEAARWSELSPRTIEKLKKLPEVLYNKASVSCEYSEDDFTVLNHGDCWVNNMLFRYDEHQKPIEHIFVDFQLSHRGSPAEDLHYFFGTSPSDDVRIYHRDLLLREYHTSLTSTMVQLNCKTEIPSFKQLTEHMKKREICEVIATMTVLPMAVLEKGEEIDIAEMLDSDGTYENPSYRGKTYRRIMTRLLPLYDSHGLLD